MCPSETVQCEDYECTDEGEEQVQQFAVVVKPDPEDEGFVATIPGVPGVVGHGHTEEEALQEAKAALESLREARNSDGGRGGIPHPFDTSENLDALAAEQESRPPRLRRPARRLLARERKRGRVRRRAPQVAPRVGSPPWLGRLESFGSCPKPQRPPPWW